MSRKRCVIDSRHTWSFRDINHTQRSLFSSLSTEMRAEQQINPFSDRAAFRRDFLFKKSLHNRLGRIIDVLSSTTIINRTHDEKNKAVKETHQLVLRYSSSVNKPSFDYEKDDRGFGESGQLRQIE